jgi:hypothetical protein
MFWRWCDPRAYQHGFELRLHVCQTALVFAQLECLCQVHNRAEPNLREIDSQMLELMTSVQDSLRIVYPVRLCCLSATGAQH